MNPLIEEVTTKIKTHKEKGRPAKLSLKQKLILILLKQFVGKSNRMMAYLLDIFFMALGIDVSYKTIERLYSDDEVKLALSNLCILILKKKEVTEIDSCGDATGYSLTIKAHYQTYASKLKEKSKVAEGKKKFVYKVCVRKQEILCISARLLFKSSLNKPKENVSHFQDIYQIIDLTKPLNKGSGFKGLELKQG